MDYDDEDDYDVEAEARKALKGTPDKSDFIDGIMDGIEERDTYEVLRDIEDQFPQYMKLYSDGRKTYAAFNAKNRGYWDNDIIRQKVAERTGKSIEEVSEILTDERLYEAWSIDVESFRDAIDTEFDGKVNVLGRAGGWWCLDVDDDNPDDIIIVQSSRLGAFFKSDDWHDAVTYFTRIAGNFDNPDECGDSFSRQFGKAYIDTFGIASASAILTIKNSFYDKLNRFAEAMYAAIRENEETGDVVIEAVMGYFDSEL